MESVHLRIVRKKLKEQDLSTSKGRMPILYIGSLDRPSGKEKCSKRDQKASKQMTRLKYGKAFGRLKKLKQRKIKEEKED